MALPFEVHSQGQGPSVLLIHGTAADRSTWAMQYRGLVDRLHLLAYDRRAEHTTVEAHADDAAQVLDEAGRGPSVVVGSSFGAIVALELARQRPAQVAGLVLLEPPLRPNDEERAVPDWFLERFNALLEAQQGPEAAEYFLRTVLGDSAYERMPRAYQERSKALWHPIRQDTRALAAYRVRYPSLRMLATPTLLLGGEKSAPFYRPTLQALQAALGRATLESLPNAGHMMHAEAHRAFNARLQAFVAEVTAP